jgi:gas vesicle protein
MKEDTLTMKRILWILTAIGIGVVAGAVLLGAEGEGKSAEEAARKASAESAQSWLALVDAGEYAKSWSAAAELFQKKVSADRWAETVRGVREELGKLVSRRPDKSDYSRSLPGAPDGEYVVWQYASAFENKKEAIESVVLLKEKDGIWKVVGYFIK